MTFLPSSEACDADVVILGASLLGVELVHQLRRRDPTRQLRLCVIDRLERHEYIPLCHERLTGRLNPQESTLETAKYVESQGGEYIADEVIGFDPSAHIVRLTSGRTVRGRVVVVALGSVVTPAPSGFESLAEQSHAESTQVPIHVRGLKFDQDVARLASLLQAAPNGACVHVVGGGISGCELAGELAELAKQRPGLKVVLVQRGARLLAGLWPVVGRRAKRILERQGVDVRLRARLRCDTDGTAQVVTEDGKGESVGAGLVVWSAGVSPPPVLRSLGLPVDEHGWLSVGTQLQCFPDARPSRPGIFAGGDVVQIYSAAGPLPAMRRAIEAIVQASALASSVVSLLRWNGNLSDYPALRPYRPLRDFPHGVSLGRRSLIVYGPICLNLLGFSVWFRRFLMRQYLARYPVPRP